jgi:Xaa-Pro aminopeptidase
MKELRTKEQRVREYMSANGLDAVLLSDRANFAWFTCGGTNHVRMDTDQGAASLLVTSDSKYIISNNIEGPRVADEEVADMGFDMLIHPWQDAGGKERLLKDVLGSGRCASDDGTPGTEPLPADFATLRYVLTSAERERLRSLCVDCGQIVADVAHDVNVGETESSIAARLAAAAFEREVMPGVVLIAADERILKYRHPVVKDTQAEEAAMVVMCGMRHGLVCSVTRIVAFGTISEELRAKHDACMAIDATLIANTMPGVKVADVLKAGLAAYDEHGYGEEWRLHHQGGAAGYQPREYLAIPDCPQIVQPNQAFAWNPSITGTKSEDTMLATDAGPEVLSLTGDWPTVECAVGGSVLERADILVK